MPLPYGYVKANISAITGLQSRPRKREIQYHLHLKLAVSGGDWEVAINVGTNDSDDLLKYKLAYDFHHPITGQLSDVADGYSDLTNKDALPALDFLRSDILAETGAWRPSDPMDGTEQAEPIPTLLRLFNQALHANAPIYVFGRRFRNRDGSLGPGIHDTHMNQGSTGGEFVHRPGEDDTDHNDIWQDGAVLVGLGGGAWAAYFAAFEQQLVPTDALGNPSARGHPIS